MGNLLVGALVFGAITLAARKVYRDRKSGKCCGQDTCCSSCAACREKMDEQRAS